MSGVWTSLWRLVTRYDAEKIVPWIALRNTIGIVLPLAAATAEGQPAAGLVMGTGALNVAFSDNEDPYARRARRMLAASLLVGSVVALASLCGSAPRLAVVMVTFWAFLAGMLVALGSTAADLGVITLVTFIIFSSDQRSVPQAGTYGLLALGGALLQTALSLALWPIRRYEPERRALAELYRELSRMAGASAPATEAPAASVQATFAHESLSHLGRDHSLEGERYRSLLNQAERTRLGLLMLSRLRTRLEREAREHAVHDLTARFFELCCQVLAAVGEVLAASAAVKIPPGSVSDVSAIPEQLRELEARETGATAVLLRDARVQMDAIAGQLRSAVDLATKISPDGKVAERREAQHAPHLRMANAMSILRANFNLNSAVFRHALRLAICVGGADAFGRFFGLSRFYWLPMTVAIVLKPDFTATFSRGVLRVAGTFIGLALATAIFEVVAVSVWLEVALLGIAAFIMRCFGPANYGIFVTALTALVVLLFALSGVNPHQVILARGLNTVIGGAMALVAYAVWPTWERTQAPEAMARLLDAYRDYFRAVREAYLSPYESFEAQLDRTRMTGRLARSNLESSVDRVFSEPGTSPEEEAKLTAMLASSHRLAHAFMALEAGLAESRPAPARAGFRSFADQVELTLYYLAAALRGSGITRSDLPDLREAHHVLVTSPAPPDERYTLVNTETDRITNSLNTLSEQLLGWLANRSA